MVPSIVNGSRHVRTPRFENLEIRYKSWDEAKARYLLELKGFRQELASEEQKISAQRVAVSGADKKDLIEQRLGNIIIVLKGLAQEEALLLKKGGLEKEPHNLAVLAQAIDLIQQRRVLTKQITGKLQDQLPEIQKQLGRLVMSDAEKLRWAHRIDRGVPPQLAGLDTFEATVEDM